MHNAFDLFIGINKTQQTAYHVGICRDFLRGIPNQIEQKQTDGILFYVTGFDNESPLIFENDRYTIIKVGRIFPNFSLQAESSYKNELTHQDLADIYKLYQTDIIRKIKGLFVLTIYDKENKCLTAFVNKSGLFKLNWYHRGDNLMLSTNLDSIIKNLSKAEPDHVAIMEQMLFGYPLGDLNIVEDVHVLDNHSFLQYSLASNETKVVPYYNLSDFLGKTGKYNWEQTYRDTPDIFNQITDMFLANDEPINASLTSGFDSRTLLSRNIAHKNRIKYYSYGATEHSDDVAIPRIMARKLNLDYTWIEFGSDYFSDYDYYANQLMYLTDGIGNIKRSNQMYSHLKLAPMARVCHTGYIGSELLRPNNMMDTNILPAMVDIVYKDRISDTDISSALSKLPLSVQPSFKEEVSARACDHIRRNLSEVMIYDQPYLNLYYFTIRYSLWKFFGQEFHASRVFTTVLSPYIDDDFVEYILQTPVPTLNKHAFKRNTHDLRKGQMFYLPILKHNYPKLMHMVTGRGYSPGQLVSPFYPVNIAIPFLYKRTLYKSLYKHAAYHASDWNKISYKAHSEVFSAQTPFFRELGDSPTLSAEYSLKKWLMDYLH